MAKSNFFCIDRVETGNRIYKYRKAMHFSRDRLADCLADKGVVVTTVSIGKWERGEVDISFVYAKALAEIFGCHLYGELVVYYLRDFDGERDQPAPLLKFHISYFLDEYMQIAYIRLFYFTNRDSQMSVQMFVSGFSVQHKQLREL